MLMCIVSAGACGEEPIFLNEEVYATMSAKEADFWRCLFKEVTASIGSIEDNMRTKGLIPTPSLTAKYHRAITEFDGRRYAQVRRMESMYIFPDLPVAA